MEPARYNNEPGGSVYSQGRPAARREPLVNSGGLFALILIHHYFYITKSIFMKEIMIMAS